MERTEERGKLDRLGRGRSSQAISTGMGEVPAYSESDSGARDVLRRDYYDKPTAWIRRLV